MSEKTNRVFEEYVPSFGQYVSENGNMPAGAEFDKRPGSPYDEYQASEWKVTGARLNKRGYLELDISGGGYPSTVEIDPGDDAVNAALGITDVTPDQEANDLLAAMIADINGNPENLPEEIRQYVSDELQDKYDENWAKDQSKIDKFDAMRDAEHDDYY